MIIVFEQEITTELETECPDVCPACQSSKLVEDMKTGEVICANCGLVVKEKEYSLTRDWRAYSFEEEKTRSRNGYALSNKIYDKGLSTTFQSGCDFKGKRLDSETQNMMLRLRKQDQRAKVNESWQRNLKIALSELSRICNELHLPDHVHERAAHIYRQILKEDLVRGRSIDGFVSASVYAACREKRIPRSIGDIASVSLLTEHEIKYHYRLLLREMNFKPPIDNPLKFLSSLTSKLKLNGNVEEYSLNLLNKAQEKKLVVGKNPKGVAAAVLYLACRELGVRITQAEVARVAETSEVTMRKRFIEYEPLI